MRPVRLLVPRWLPGPGCLRIPSSDQAPPLPERSPCPDEPGRSERPTVPPPVGGRTGQSVLVLLVIDESSSELQADPHGYRHLAGRRTLSLLKGGLKHHDDRLAVVHFAERPDPWIGPTNPHTRAGHHALRHALQPVGTGGRTDIRAALQLAATLIPVRPDAAVVVVLLSDGQDASTTEQLTTAVGRFPSGAVHLISIAAGLPATWAAVPLGSVTDIPSLARPDEVEWATARVLYQALGVGWDGPVQPPTRTSAR